MSASFLTSSALRSADAGVAVVQRSTKPKALTAAETEPSRERAVELLLLGHLLEAHLLRAGVCTRDAAFSYVWRDHVVPLAAVQTTEWQLGMCAEITGRRAHV